MSEQHNVTIKDIAQKLKLSVSTVSRALRDSTEIKPATRQLVRELAAELRYSPNPIALSLKEKKSKIIGVIVPEIANNFCAATIAGIEDIAYSRGYHVIIFQSHEKFEREVINTQLLTSRRIEGLIISLSNETTSLTHIHEMIGKGIPVVMFDRVSDEITTHKVVVNDYYGAYKATEHLIQEGFHDIVHLTISPFLSITQKRLNGYCDALRKYNIPQKKEWIVHCNFDAAEIERSIRRLFSGPDKPNAILASVERLATICMNVLRDMNLRIPDDVALVGFSDNPISHLLSPALTSVRQPTFDIGQQAAELMLNLIENKHAVPKFRTVQLETALDIQASSRRVGVLQEGSR
ncbi:LacI family DNA-binding transcriptional regulator [Puia sp.]|jgi:LacI family transcriptional regulator|uniref:LacI family DNA-binding transcriptional regulator n=1 Tax=Puia sp. TaxID=2045100 RepID=UPI002F40066E